MGGNGAFHNGDYKEYCLLVEIRLLPLWLAAFEQAQKYRHSKDVCVKDKSDKSRPQSVMGF
jgi:hypothetical protein